MTRKCLSILILFFIVGMLFTGCNEKLTESEVNYAGPILDNILKGIQDRDYRIFARDFSGNLKNALKEKDFDSLIKTLDSKIGEYKEKRFSSAKKTKSANMDLTIVVYKAKYSKESKAVSMTIYFSDNHGKKTIEGFRIDSPTLQQ